MALNNFINIPQAATQGGAPIDAFQGDAFRQNDNLFEQSIRNLVYNLTLFNTNVDGSPTLTAGSDTTRVWQTLNATLNGNLALTQGVPLVVMALGTAAAPGVITVNGPITGVGAGMPGAVGHLGGSGGGGTGSAGRNTVIPLSNALLAQGGAVGTNNGTSPLNNNHILRSISLLPVLAGGAAGGDSSTGGILGGPGGGVVILIADTINWAGGTINVSGGPAGGAGAGGGGGGAIILMAKTFDAVPTVGASFIVSGGNGNGGGNGGSGRLFVINLP